MTDTLAGNRTFDGIDTLELNIRNGTVDCEQADLPAGHVSVDWEYRNVECSSFNAEDIELRLTTNDSQLKLVDWCREHTSFVKQIPVKLELKLRHGPGVRVLAANHGNGTFNYDGTAAGSFNLGNGTLNLAGEPAGDMAVNVGNGKLITDWLLNGPGCVLNVGNGQTEIGLKPGSGVSFDGSVGIGGISAPAGIKVKRAHLLGSEASGTLGSGASRLAVTMGNGNIDVACGG